MESASLPGRELWEAPPPPAPPTPSSSRAPALGGPASRSLPAAPCQRGPTPQARLSGCLSGGVQLPGIRGTGLQGIYLQPVQAAQALGPGVTEVL